MKTMPMTPRARPRLALAAALLILAAGGMQARDLGMAINANDLNKVKAIIEADPQRLNKPVPFNSYPLFMAIDKFNVPMITYLLEQGAKVTAIDDKGETALTKLVKVNFHDEKRFAQVKEVFQLLLDHKANVRQQNKQGETPLYILAARQIGGEKTAPLKIEFMKLLVEKGARPRGQDKATMPLLFKVMEHMQKSDDSRRNVVGTIRFLAENGVEIDPQNDKGDTPLMRVVTTDALEQDAKVELIGILVGHGASIRRKNKEKKAPIDMVAKGDPLFEAMRKKPGR
jgi:ankyrin repeat protein